MAHVSSEYIAAGCNCGPHVLDWCANGSANDHAGWLCYGSCHALVLASTCDATGVQPVRTLATLAHHHTDDIVACRWSRPVVRPPLSSIGEETTQRQTPLVAVTGSADKTAGVWWIYVDTTTATHDTAVESCDNAPYFVRCFVLPLKAHSASVTQVEAVSESSHQGLTSTLVFTAGADLTVRVWSVTSPQPPPDTATTRVTVDSAERHGASVCLRQTIELASRIGGGSLVMCLHALCLQQADATTTTKSNLTNVSLLAALDDNSVAVLANGGENGARDEHETQYGCVGRLTGHTDWVRSIDSLSIASAEQDASFLLATAGQDCMIRVWHVDITCSSVDRPRRATNGQLTVKARTFDVADGRRLTVRLESVLSGHTGWVYGTRWIRRLSAVCLLSAGIDGNVLVWRRPQQQQQHKPRLEDDDNQEDSSDDVWLESGRMVVTTPHNAGLYGCVWLHDGNCHQSSVLAHGFRGELYVWRQHFISTDTTSDEDWRALAINAGGHFGGVNDLCWARQSPRPPHTTNADRSIATCALLSCSADRTTRLHVCHVAAATRGGITWHEHCRPQVHGHALYCAAFVGRSWRAFVSCGEEKVVRAFSVSTSQQACDGGVDNDDDGNDERVGSQPSATTAVASLPELSLTIRPDISRGGGGVSLHGPPPTEHVLGAGTLWPELRKLYGHGYEVVALACDAAGGCVATACRATQACHAAVLVWSTAGAAICDGEAWKLVAQLQAGQQLTVVQLAFSPDSGWLVAVSRDRSVAVFRRRTSTDGRQPQDGDVDTWSSHTRVADAHARVVWCCAWTDDSQCFVTASRDKRALTWRRSTCSDAWTVTGRAHVCDEAVTAVALTQCGSLHVRNGGGILMAVGLESGIIQLLTSTASLGRWRLVRTLSSSQAHHLTVKRLQFRPPATLEEKQEEEEREVCVQLASCSLDHCVKVHSVSLARESFISGPGTV